MSAALRAPGERGDRGRTRAQLGEILGPVVPRRDDASDWAEMEEPAQRVALVKTRLESPRNLSLSVRVSGDFQPWQGTSSPAQVRFCQKSRGVVRSCKPAVLAAAARQIARPPHNRESDRASRPLTAPVGISCRLTSLPRILRPVVLCQPCSQRCGHLNAHVSHWRSGLQRIEAPRSNLSGAAKAV